ncbi:hypothetical protein MMC20_007614 [Loxospora ochrophaea]|nr:hypothetical protein [Loxospora ochrophaea]
MPPIVAIPSTYVLRSRTSGSQQGAAGKKQKPRGVHSLFAGALAGATEISITYPAEFAKTRSQLNRRLPHGQKLPWPRFGAAWYAGYTTLLVGSTIKAGIQFTAFDTFRSMLADADGKVSGPRNLAAGFGAGIMESVLAVTPSESIKTKLIDDRKSGKPRMRGFLHGVSVIARERGIRGIFTGLVPTTARQSVNAAVKFGSYNKFKEIAQSYMAPGQELGIARTFGVGVLTGICSVYTSQPLDVIKTRMQSIDAKSTYGSSFNCVKQILRDEGVRVFWSGALPRLARLSLTSGIMFTIYENTTKFLKKVEDGDITVATVGSLPALRAIPQICEGWDKGEDEYKDLFGESGIRLGS